MPPLPAMQSRAVGPPIATEMMWLMGRVWEAV